MEISTVLPFSRPSISTSRPQAQPFKPWSQRTSLPTRSLCHKMYVPGFGISPEKRAAKHLHDFFNFIAVKIVAAQLQRYNREAYQELMEFLERNSLNDGDNFCEKLMRESPRHKKLALRIMEVRSAYCKDDFEWEHLQSLSSETMEEYNTRLMREYVQETSCLENGT